MASILKSVTRDRVRYEIRHRWVRDRFVDREGDKEKRVERSGLDQTFSKVTKEKEEEKGEEEEVDSEPVLARPTTGK